MQILHTGRYGYHYSSVSASPLKSPIGWATPKELSHHDVLGTIDDFVKCAELAKSVGYDGVEIMGSEGYLINQFIAAKTNKRTDQWGGSYENRIRFPTEIVRRVRKAVGKDFIIIYRLSMLDLVDEGSSFQEIVELAQKVEACGASIINTGIGWHEARVPTIATMVPRGAFAWVTKKLKGHVNIPLCTTNRINSPAVAESILSDGSADMVSMARPLLADPYFVVKAQEGREEEINTCIACNQACLDHVFQMKRASCLVNPRACYETTLKIEPVAVGKKMKIAVIGAGPSGLACSTTAAQRGHDVTLFEKDSVIGGQFNMAKLVPGKEEFFETLRYFSKQIELTGVKLRLNTMATAADLKDFDAVVVCSGVTPRHISIPRKGDRVNLVSYVDVLKHGAKVGQRVAVVGAGGIGFDVSDFLTHPHDPTHPVTPAQGLAETVDPVAVSQFLASWGVDTELRAGGLLSKEEYKKGISTLPKPNRKVYLLQRKEGKLGSGLGKTTGWIHRTTLKHRAVEEMDGCKYIEINDTGLVIERNGKQSTLEVDTVVICAGQEPMCDLLAPAKALGKKVYIVGGAFEAGELDAKRAIDQGTRLAAAIENTKSGEVLDAPVSLIHRIAKTFKLV